MADGTFSQTGKGGTPVVPAVAPDNMYRIPATPQPPAAAPQVMDWSSTVGHLSPGPGTSDQSLDGNAVVASRDASRAMSVGSGSAGGYAVPAAYDVGTKQAQPAPRPKRRQGRRNGGRQTA